MNSVHITAPSITIGFIGASKTGTNLAKYFKLRSLNVLGFYSLHADSALESANITNTQVFDTIDDLVYSCDLIFITVDDANINKVVLSVYKAFNKFNTSDKAISHKYLCHCSGFYNSELLHYNDSKLGISTHTIHLGSMHPLFSFYNKNMPIDKLHQALFTIEGDANYITLITQIMQHLQNPFFLINKTDKIKYHLSCVLLSSGILSILSIVENLVTDIPNFPIDKALELSHDVINNYATTLDIHTVLTGPIKRQDTNVINQYYNILDMKQSKLWSSLVDTLLPYVNKPYVNENIHNKN